MFGHALADYAWQTDFIAKGKNRFTPIPGVPWYYIMAAHSMIHAGMVGLFTGRMEFAIAEFALHFMIDCMKCEGITNIHHDQAAHTACKLAWSIL
jgi:hypothetical protein